MDAMGGRQMWDMRNETWNMDYVMGNEQCH